MGYNVDSNQKPFSEMLSYQHPTISEDDTAVPLGTTTHDAERVVPSGMTSWTWEKAGVVLLGLLGLTAMVASGGAAPIFPSLVTSSESARTEEAFLLQARGGANDDTCVPATGPWPTGAVSQNDDAEPDTGASDGPYVTCFTARGGYCWSHSYYDDGWKSCTPHGSGWSVYAHTDDDDCLGLGHTATLKGVSTCGTGCTEFSSDVPS